MSGEFYQVRLDRIGSYFFVGRIRFWFFSRRSDPDPVFSRMLNPDKISLDPQLWQELIISVGLGLNR